MIKNIVIALLTLTLAGFILTHVGVFENIDPAGRDERTQHSEKRKKTVRKTQKMFIGSVYSSKDVPAAEAVKGAALAAEIQNSKGMNIEYITEYLLVIYLEANTCTHLRNMRICEACGILTRKDNSDSRGSRKLLFSQYK